jgi:nucleoside-diphosphate-sugar epimerase
MARILIAGCGQVGTLLGIALQKAGHVVWGLKRQPSTLPAALQPLSGDLSAAQSLNHLPPDLDYVFYTAAPDGFSEPSYRAVYVDGVANLMSALQHRGEHPRRIFLTSSTSVYSQHQGEWVDENSPAAPSSFSGRLIRQGETLLWQGSYPATIIRFGGIYGPGRLRLLDTLRKGNATCIEHPPLYTNRIHLEDCAAALQHLLRLADPEPLYLGVDNDPAPQCTVLRWLAEQLGVPGPTVVAAATGPEAVMRANKRCSNARLRASGFRLRYPSYQDGYSTLLTQLSQAQQPSDRE